MKWNDNIFEEDHVLVTEGHGEARNDACEDIEQLGSAIELVCFVNQSIEALIDCLTNHLSSWHQLNKTRTDISFTDINQSRALTRC